MEIEALTLGFDTDIFRRSRSQHDLRRRKRIRRNKPADIDQQ
jgi:hypothetical protein